MSDAVPTPPPPQRPLRSASRPRSFKTMRTVLALIMREIQTTYGRKIGGYLWALLEPIFGIIFMVVIFTVALKFRQPGLGNSFALFYTTGLMPLGMFLGVANKVSQSLAYSKPLLTYPGVEYTDAIVARFILAAMTQLIVAVLLFVGIHLMFSVETILNVPAILIGFATMALCGLGIGVLNCYVMSVFPLYGSVWAIITRPLFIFSTIFFTYEDVPREFRDVLWWNPIVHGVGMVRRGFYATYDASWISNLYPLVLGLVAMALGLAFLQRYHGDILNR